MEDKIWEITWRKSLFGIAIDIIISFSVSLIFAEPDRKLQTAIIVFFFIVFIKISIEIRNWLESLIFYYYFGRHYFGNAILVWLRKENMPPPSDHYRHGLTSYLRYLAENEYIDCKFRIKSAASYIGITSLQKVQSNAINKMMNNVGDKMLNEWADEVSKSYKKG